ncbi:unnamed protein product [Cuscuta campestris]|uniref:Transposase (putative) gypsy type domain-containing protein n=1 Tax=Cuscuta campestris TaxID=132261 RepID=A0A484L4L4_9ASTE|nr:unnamed protein product [Cuscuta campestris]
MVGPSIEVLRPTKTQTALYDPLGFFTVHLASLKKGLCFPLHPLLIKFLNLVDLLPCQLVPNSHRYIAGYLVRCKDVEVKPTLDHFLFTFKLTKGHKDWASYASLSQRSSKLFTSDKKGSTKDWKPFFVFVSTGPESPFTGSGRPSFRRIPCPPSDATLPSITRQLCNKGAMNIKEVVSEESLTELGFEFVRDELRHQPDLLRDNPGGSQHDQLRDTPRGGLDCGPFVESPELEEEMDNNLLLSRFTVGRKRKRETKGQGKRSSSHQGESPPREPALIVVEDQDDATLETERPPLPPAVTYEVATGGRSTRLCIPSPPQSLGDVQLETLITLPAEDQARISVGSEDDLDNMVLLRLSQGTLGMIEVVGRKRGRQAALNEAMKTSEAKQKELQVEVARLTRELEEKESRCAALVAEKAFQADRCVALEADKASLSTELEVERSDRVRHAEEAVESFKSSPDFTMVTLERMDKLTAEWLKTKPGAQWMVNEGTKSFNYGLFRAQQVFRDRLAQLPKGFSLLDLGFPPPCRSLAELDPSPYLDGGSSSASEGEEEEEDGQGDRNPGASLTTSKLANRGRFVRAQLLIPARLPDQAQSQDWPTCRPTDPMPLAISDWTFTRLKAALSKLIEPFSLELGSIVGDDLLGHPESTQDLLGYKLPHLFFSDGRHGGCLDPLGKVDDRDHQATTCKKHNLDNVAKAAIFKTLDPITFSKIKHLKTAMEIWQGLGKLCEGSEDLRKQKIEVLLEKFKGFKMLPGESFDMLDERFHKILNDLASLNHVLSPKEKNVRLLRSLPTEWYTKATAMEEGRNLENYTVQGDGEACSSTTIPKDSPDPSVVPKSTAKAAIKVAKVGAKAMGDGVPASNQKLQQPKEKKSLNGKQPGTVGDDDQLVGTSSTPTHIEEAVQANSKVGASNTEKGNKPTGAAKKADETTTENPPKKAPWRIKLDKQREEKPGHWKSACPYPKVEKYGERERIEKKKKAMVAAESDESSSSSSDEEALVCMERRVEKSNHEDRWTMSEDDTLCLMAKDDADQEVTSQTSCSSSYESIPTSENLFDQFKKMMKDFEEINLKHTSLTEENKLLSEENLKLTESRKSQLNEITQLKTENESLSEKVKSLNKELGILKSQEAVNKLLETTKHKGRKGLGFDSSISKRKEKTTFIPPKPTAKPNKTKGKEKEKPTEVPKKDMASLKNISTNEVILTGKRIRNIYEVIWSDVKEACLISKVNHNCEQILDDYWVWQRNPEDLHLEYLANTPVSDSEADDEDLAVFKSVFSKDTEDQVVFTSEAQGVLEAAAEDFQTLPETSHVSEMVLTEVVEEKATSPPQEQNQETAEEEEFQPLIQSQGLEILTTPCEISNPTEIEISEKSAETPEHTAKKSGKLSTASIQLRTGWNRICRNPEDLHLEYLANTPVSDCEADDEDTAVFKPVFSKATEDQVALTSEATAEDFQTFPETSPALETETSPAFQETSHASEMVLTEVVQEKATPPSKEQNQETADEEEFQPLIQSQVLEILTTPCAISNPTEIEIPEKSAEIPEQSALPETMEQAVEAQRNSGEAAKEAQMAELEVSETQVAILEEENTAEERDSLSRDISNFALETEGESERTLKVTDEEDVQEDAESLSMQLFQKTPSSHQVTNFHFHSSSTPALPDEIPEIWTKKVQGLIGSALASQHASFRQEIEQMEVRHTQLIEKSEGKHSVDLKEISKSVQKTLEIISLLSETVVTKDYLKVIIDNQKEAYKLFRLIGANFGNRKMEVILQQHSPSPIPQLPIAIKEGEVSYIPSHLNLTNLILEAQQRNPENSAQLLSSSGLDGTEVIRTVVDHFSNDAQSEERRENLRRIKETEVIWKLDILIGNARDNSGDRSPTSGSSSSSSSDSEHPATSPQKKPVDASTCAPSSSVAQVVSVAQPGDEDFIRLDDRLIQEQPSYMQKPQIHELRNMMPDGYQLTYRATGKNIISLHVDTSIGIHCHSIKDLGEFSIHPFKVLFFETYGIMPGQLALNGHRLLGSFINVCRFLRIPLSLRLFDHIMKRQVKPTEADDLVAWETTLRARDASTRGLYHVGKWSVYPGRETDPEPEIFLPGAIPEAIPIRRAMGSKALATATAGPSRLGKKKKEKVVKFQSKFAIPQIVVEEPSTAQPLNPPSSQPFSLEEKPAQSHHGTNQPIHSGELYINHVGRIGEYFARLVKSKDDEKARMEAMMVECWKEAQTARAQAEKLEAKWVEHCAAYRQFYAKHDGLLKAAKEADEQDQEKIQRLEADNARSAEEIARLGDELEKERADLAAAWVIQEPEEFAARAMQERETAIRFFQGLYKNQVSAGIVDEIGTFGFESGQYTERRTLYGILEQRIQGFRPKALSLPELHDEAPVPPFPGI